MSTEKNIQESDLQIKKNKIELVKIWLMIVLAMIITFLVIAYSSSFDKATDGKIIEFLQNVKIFLFFVVAYLFSLKAMKDKEFAKLEGEKNTQESDLQIKKNKIELVKIWLAFVFAVIITFLVMAYSSSFDKATDGKIIEFLQSANLYLLFVVGYLFSLKAMKDKELAKLEGKKLFSLQSIYIDIDDFLLKTRKL